MTSTFDWQRSISYHFVPIPDWFFKMSRTAQERYRYLSARNIERTPHDGRRTVIDEQWHWRHLEQDERNRRREMNLERKP